MSLKNSAFLEELFPEPMSSRKGRYSRTYEKNRSTAAFRFSSLSSKTKAQGVVSKRPEVMIRVGRTNIKSYRHLIKTADYIARHGDIELEDQDGSVFFDKASYRRKIYEWKLLSDIGEEDTTRGHARRIILSMPVGTPEEGFKKACTEWAKEMLSGYDYLLAFHFAETDKKTSQPHCHILLRTLNKEGKRFHLDNQEMAAFREHFASCLMKQGIEANATKRWSRCKVNKSLSQAEYNVTKNRALSDEERARIYAMSKKRSLLRTQKSHIDNVVAAAKSQKTIEDHPAIQTAKETRKWVQSLAFGAAQELMESKDEADRKLGNNLKNHYSNLEPVESKEQRMLRQLNEARFKQIQRMQAMKKRKAFDQKHKPQSER